MKLPAETVTRELPVLKKPEDAGLFRRESSRRFEAVETRLADGDFLPAGWQGDLDGWRGALKHLGARMFTKRERFDPESGRQPLIATDRHSNGYFHWVTEVLPRLWWIRGDLHAFELLLPSFAARFPYMADSLAVFSDLRFRILPQRSHWKVEGGLIVPPTAPTGNYRPELLRDVAQAWRALTGAAEPFRKVYISRSRAARRRIANEAEVRQRLEERGYETVHLEEMAFRDQVRLLAETRELLSNHGAGLTNALFMLPGTRVTEIRLEGDAHNNCYFSLARAVGLDYGYVLAPPRNPGEAAHTADLLVPVEALP